MPFNYPVVSILTIALSR